MDRVCLIGASWRTVGVDGLEEFTIPREERPERLAGMLETVGVEELVYLATCNRVELTLVGDAEVPPDVYRARVFEALTGRPARNGEAEGRLRAWVGEGAAEHLFMVAAGMDSAKIGEREIMGQVRDAADLSEGIGLLGERLDVVFTAALKLARRVHLETVLGSGRTSLATVAADEVRRFGQSYPEGGGAVVLVGVSAMTRTCGRELTGDGIPLLVVNRSPERGVAFAAEFGAPFLTLADFVAAPKATQAMVISTGAPDPLFDRRDLERIAEATPGRVRFLAIDMAVPPNVPVAETESAGWQRVGMDAIVRHAERHRDARVSAMADARVLVDDALDDLRNALAERTIAPALAALRGDFKELARVCADRVLGRQLAHLSGPDREHVRHLADSIARRLAHVPLRGLRHVVADGGVDAVRRFLAASDRSLDDAVQAVDQRVGQSPDHWTDDEPG